MSKKVTVWVEKHGNMFKGLAHLEDDDSGDSMATTWRSVELFAATAAVNKVFDLHVQKQSIPTKTIPAKRAQE